jgi:hypothetical protein
MMNLCDSYCTHGGICELNAGHEGQHDSRYCQWTDAEALSKSDADDLFRDKADEFGLPDEATEAIVRLT